MSTFLEKYVPFLHEEDYFLAIELLGKTLRGSLVAVSPETKLVRVLRVVERPVLDQPSEAFVEELPALLKEFKLPATVRMLALLDHRRATILSGVVSLMRSDPKAEIKQAELENLISQGLWKLVNQHRGRAAKKMEIPEVRVGLADADVVQVKLNNHRVVNPIGFTARSVEFCCRETFVDRVLLERLMGSLTEDNLAAVVEAPAVLAGLVARFNPQAEFLFISVGATESVIYYVDQMASSYIDSFGWGSQTLLAGVAGQFGIDVAAAEKVLEQYSRQEVSGQMRKAVEAAASGELAILTNGVASHQPQGRTVPVYIHAALPLPAFLFDSTFAKRLGLRLTLTAVNNDFIGQRTGFVVELEKAVSLRGRGYTFDAVLATIAELYAVSSAPGMSKTAKQRARWIRAAGQ